MAAYGAVGRHVQFSSLEDTRWINLSAELFVLDVGDRFENLRSCEAHVFTYENN